MSTRWHLCAGHLRKGITNVSIERTNPFECDSAGCGAIRRSVNHWWIVHTDSSGVHIYEWDKCPDRAREDGRQFCGVGHTMAFVSDNLMPHTRPDPERESTLELKP